MKNFAYFMLLTLSGYATAAPATFEVSDAELLESKQNTIRMAFSANRASSIFFDTIELCSAKKCSSATLNKQLDIHINDHGKAKHVNISTTEQKITSIKFKSLNQEIKLRKPIELNEFNHSALYFIVTDNGQSKKITDHASLKSNRENNLHYYDPNNNFSMHNEAQGVKIEIPKHAIKNAAIFNINVHDIGYDKPVIEIWPKCKLIHPASVFYEPVKKKVTNSPNSTTTRQSPSTAPKGPLIPPPNGTNEGFNRPSPNPMQIKETGIISSIQNNEFEASTFFMNSGIEKHPSP